MEEELLLVAKENVSHAAHDVKWQRLAEEVSILTSHLFCYSTLILFISNKNYSMISRKLVWLRMRLDPNDLIQGRQKL